MASGGFLPVGFVAANNTAGNLLYYMKKPAMKPPVE
jgi:hypothetical protein